MAFKLNITVLKDGEVFPAGTEFHGDNKPAFLTEMVQQGHAIEIPELVKEEVIVVEDEDKLNKELEDDDDKEPVVEDDPDVPAVEEETETPTLKKRK